MTTPAPATPAAPPVADVLGETLHVGSVVVDVKGGPHLIDHFTEYPGQYKGDHARRAYDADETWRATVGDHEHFHCLQGEEMNNADVIEAIVNGWIDGRPAGVDLRDDRATLILALLGEFERVALAERVRIVAEVRAFADEVRGESLTGPITAGIIDQAADRINTLKD